MIRGAVALVALAAFAHGVAVAAPLGTGTVGWHALSANGVERAQATSGANDQSAAGLSDISEPSGCAAIEIYRDSGAEGNGRGATIEAPRDDALSQCQAQSGKVCVIVSSACNPNG